MKGFFMGKQGRAACLRLVILGGSLCASSSVLQSDALAAPTPAPAEQAAHKTEPRHFGPSGDPVVDARAAELGRKLRCPVCQGMPIAESPATMAVDMMQQVRKMLAAGQSDAAIVDYFTSRYGQWVLLEPPHDGFALWVWILPPLSCLALLALAWRIVWRLRTTVGAGPITTAPTGAGVSGAAVLTATSPDAEDATSLLAAIRKEVEDA